MAAFSFSVFASAATWLPLLLLRGAEGRGWWRAVAKLLVSCHRLDRAGPVRVSNFSSCIVIPGGGSMLSGSDAARSSRTVWGAEALRTTAWQRHDRTLT